MTASPAAMGIAVLGSTGSVGANTLDVGRNVAFVGNLARADYLPERME